MAVEDVDPPQSHDILGGVKLRTAVRGSALVVAQHLRLPELQRVAKEEPCALLDCYSMRA